MIDFFLKLFKAFNSSQTPWQMSLALSMGMAMGLTPYSGIQTIVLIFLAFIINIHIGLFLVSSALFAGVAYILDPYFEAIGFALLNSEALKDFFTAAYNSGLLRLTYFNNTIVIGSNIIAFSLLLPMFFILNKVVYIYRDKIAAKLQQYTILKKLGIEVSDKKDKLFRVWGIALFALLGGVVALFSILFLDSFAKSLIEDSLGESIEKKVSIGDMKISLKEGMVNLDNLYVADDKKVLLSAKNINFDIDFNQLLFQRYHIESINFGGMTFDRAAKDGEVLYSKASVKTSSTPVEQKEESGSDLKEKSSFKLPSISLEKPEVLIQRMGLSSLKNYENAEKEINEIHAKYKKILERDFSQKEIDEIQKDIKNIQSKINPKDVQAALQLTKDVNALKKKIEEKQKLLANLNREFIKDKKSIQKHYKDLKNGAASDYESLQNEYSFDKKGGVNIVGVLFGDKIKKYLGSSLEYYEMAEPYLKSDDEAEEVVPKRGEGRWIRFKEDIPSVNFWIKRTNISGVLAQQSFKAAIKDISSNQSVLNLPTKFVYKSDGVKLKELAVLGEDNRIKEKAVTKAKYTLSEGSIENTDLSFMNLSEAKYSLSGTFKAEDYSKLDSQTTVLFTSASLSLKESKGDLMKGLEDILREVDSFDLRVDLSGSLTNVQVSAQSNLDKKLSSAFSKVLEQEVKRYKKELKGLINLEVNSKLKELGLKEQELSGLDELFSGRGTGMDVLQSNSASVEKKIEDQVNKELEKKKKELEKKANDEIKKLMKSIKF